VNVDAIGVLVAEQSVEVGGEIGAVDDRSVDHHGVMVESPHRQLASGQLARKCRAWRCWFARMKVKKNGAGRSVRRFLIERIVRDQHEFLPDLCVSQTLAARVPGLLLSHVGWPARSTKSVSRVRVDSDESERIHVTIVRMGDCID
jgi:hypothetical protein